MSGCFLADSELKFLWGNIRAMVPCAILDDVMIRNLVVVVFSLHHRLRVDEHTEIQKSRAGLAPFIYP